MKKFIVVFLFLCTSFVNSQDYFLKENIDYSVKPGEDFFMFANGNFIKAHPIPPEEHTYGIFNLVEDSVYVYLQRICESAMNTEGLINGTNKQKIGDFYRSGLDTNLINSKKLAPLKKYFDKIDGIKNVDDIINVTTELQKYFISPLFSFYVGQDLMNSEKYSVYFSQGGIGLPERDYYFNNDERNKNIRSEYKKHLQKTFSIINDSRPDKSADVVYKIEYDLAKSSRKLEDLRDDYANYNKMTLKELSKLAPSVNWSKMISDFGLNNINEIIVGQPEFFKELESVLNKYSIEDWKLYLKWNVVNSTANLLSSDVERLNFDFYGKVMSGTTEQRPRWKSVLDNTNDLLGEILGEEYVNIYFPPEDKVRIVNLVSNMVNAFESRIKKLDWMSESTKLMAIKKLGTMVKKIGYPDVWKDYSTLEITKESYFDNVQNARNWQFRDMVSRYGKPVDRTEWHMTPQTYNAYYNPSNNEIVIPAAILTIPGKKMSEVDDAFLYGFIGASTIGHEMTHGFDDQGRLYDEKGNLKGWWTVDDSTKFVSKSQLMIDQFNGYVVLDSMKVNGKATLGENIADLGGLVIGLEAMLNSEEGKSNKEIDGFNALQRYFLGYAYSWAVYYRPETLARRIMTDVHSPAFLRVNGPYSNIKEFYDAFKIKEGDRLYRSDKVRVEIW